MSQNCPFFKKISFFSLTCHGSSANFALSPPMILLEKEPCLLSPHSGSFLSGWRMLLWPPPPPPPPMKLLRPEGEEPPTARPLTSEEEASGSWNSWRENEFNCTIYFLQTLFYTHRQARGIFYAWYRAKKKKKEYVSLYVSLDHTHGDSPSFYIWNVFYASRRWL